MMLARVSVWFVKKWLNKNRDVKVWDNLLNIWACPTTAKGKSYFHVHEHMGRITVNPRGRGTCEMTSETQSTSSTVVLLDGAIQRKPLITLLLHAELDSYCCTVQHTYEDSQVTSKNQWRFALILKLSTSTQADQIMSQQRQIIAYKLLRLTLHFYSHMIFSRPYWPPLSKMGVLNAPQDQLREACCHLANIVEERCRLAQITLILPCFTNFLSSYVGIRKSV